MGIFSAASYQPTLFSAAVAAIGAVILCLGIWVLRGDRRDAERRAYFDFCVALFLVLLFIAVPLAAVDGGVARFWDRIGWAALLLVPPIILRFESLHLRLPGVRRWVPALFAANAALIPFLATDLFVDGNRVVSYPWGDVQQLNAVGYVFIAEFYAVFLYILVRHWKRLREQGAGGRRKAYLASFVAMIFGLLASSDFLGYMGVAWPPFSFVFLAVWAGLFAYGIVRYEVFPLTEEIAAPAIIESMPGALFVVDMDGEIVIANPYASKITKVSVHEMRGRRVTEFVPKAAGLLVEALEHPPLGPLRDEAEAELKDAEGRKHPVALSAMAIHGDRDVPIGVTIIATDIERLKEQVAIIESQKAALEKSVASLTKFQEQLVGRELKMIELKKEVERLRKA